MRLPIEYGALTAVPVWEDHSRGKNWLATITINPRAPGGLERVFQDHAHGDDYYYMADGLVVNTAVEFGADYYTSGGKRRRLRWYGVITELNEEEMILFPYESAQKAVKFAKERDRTHADNRRIGG